MVLAAFAAYFAAQAALRILLGGALEVDEAEMLVLARHFAPGYGPQLPLYNWMQAAAFAALGPGTAALALLKNAVLWAAYAGLYLGLRRAVSQPQAVVGVAGLFLLPNVVWEFQRASTHSIVLLAAMCWTVWVVFGLVTRGLRGDYLWLGVVAGLGGLSKANFALFPLALLIAAAGMADLPRRLSGRGLALAAAVAAGIVAGPFLWIWQNPALATASNWKMQGRDSALPAWAEGLAEALGGLAAGLVPVLLAAGLLFWLSRRAMVEGPGWPARLMLRAGGVALLASLLAVLAAGMTEVQSRWLVPVMALLGPGLMLAVARRMGLRARRGLGIALGAVAALALAGMAELRVNGRTTGGIDFAPLAALADRLGPDLAVGEYHLTGNLALLRPDLAVLPPLPLPAPEGVGRVLLLDRGGQSDAAAALARHGLRPGAVLAEGTLALPYRHAPGAGFDLHWRLMGAAR